MNLDISQPQHHILHCDIWISPLTFRCRIALMGVSSQNLGRALARPIFLYPADPSDRQAGAPRPERALHQHAVDPAAMLEADRLEGPRQLEPAGAMQRDRGRVAGITD